MKVLVIGGGGREHALVWKLARSPRRPRLFAAPGNAGTAALAENLALRADDFDRLLDFATAERIDLAIVGPEEPLCAGIVNRFEAAGLRAFGPSAAAARLEGDKAWAKQLMRACGVPTAEARIFAPSEHERAVRRLADKPGEQDAVRHVVQAYELAREYVATRDSGLVVKAAGLAKGKGVFVCDEPAQALRVLEDVMVRRTLGPAGETVVVEERLTGREVSILALVDGRSIYVLEPVQDYKRLRDGDAGPNTGGMGAYSPAPALSEDILRQIEAEILVPILDGLRREEIEYRGVLYAGLMLTPGGAKVLEFNCRFGDPETQPLMMRLKTDLLDLIEATMDGRLDRVSLEWDPRPAVCVVAAAPGYPDAAQTGQEIQGLERAAALDDVQVFHAGTRREGGDAIAAGGRVLGVTAIAADLEAARRRAYEALGRVRFEGMQWRTDIAAPASAGHDAVARRGGVR